MTNSQDGGAISSWAVGPNITIERNLVHDMQAFDTGAYLMGIYLDDASKGFTVRNNIITRLKGSDGVFPMCIKGLGNIVTNNVIADNEGKAAFSIVEAGMANLPDSIPGVKDELVANGIFVRNIVYRNSGPEVYKLFPWRENLVGRSDYNLFYNPTGKYEVMIDWQDKPWNTWTDAFGGRYERHTLYEDPMFVNPAAMDYRVKPGSPALKLGFKNIDLAGLGLKGDFPFKRQVRPRCITRPGG
jgi:hypothetical protein